MSLEIKDTKNYINVLASTGDFRMTVPQGTEGAKKRDYETSDGKKGTKYELVYKSVGGQIVAADFFEGDYGKNLLLTFDLMDGSDDVIVSLATNSPYGEDVLKKLPNLDFNKEVTFTPYNFDDDQGKNRKGVSIVQDGEKITGAFYDPETKKNLLGYPEPEGDTDEFDKDDWKMYFTQARKFLVKYAEDHFPEWVQAVEVEEEKDEDEGF